MKLSTGQIIKDERKKQKLTQSDLAGDFISVENLIQIEGNQVKASISTLSYIAKSLNLNIEQLMSEQSKVEQLALIASELMANYKDNQFELIINQLNDLKVQAPVIFHHNFIKDIYINTYFKYGDSLIKEGQFDEALKCYTVLLSYEEEFMLDNELIAYELYTKLVEVYSMNQEHELARDYNVKAKKLIRKMMSAKEVQNLYLLMTGSEPSEVIKAAQNVDTDMLDDYSRAKMNMVVGQSYFAMKDYKKALKFLHQAIKYYEEKTYNSLTSLMYEEVSKCYSNLDEHELAVEYMIKVKKSQQQRHQLS